MNVSGFRNLERVGTLVIANMGNLLTNFDGFNSLYEASILIITRNNVSESAPSLVDLGKCPAK